MIKSILASIIATLATPVIAVASDTNVPEERVRILDTDADNQVSLVEFLAAGKPQEEFVELDTDSDGYATVAEFRARNVQPPGAISRPARSTRTPSIMKKRMA